MKYGDIVVFKDDQRHWDTGRNMHGEIGVVVEDDSTEPWTWMYNEKTGGIEMWAAWDIRMIKIGKDVELAKNLKEES